MTCNDVYNFENKLKATSIDVNKQSFTDVMEACRFIVAEDLVLWSNFTHLQELLKISIQMLLENVNEIHVACICWIEHFKQI